MGEARNARRVVKPKTESAIIDAIRSGDIPASDRTIVVNNELVTMLEAVLLDARRGEITALAFVSSGPDKFKFDQRCLNSGQAITLLGQLRIFERRLQNAIDKDLSAA